MANATTASLTPEQVVGKRIRMIRDLKQMKQRTLATECFVSQPAVSQWERGVKMPRRAMQFRVADILGVDRSELFAEVLGRRKAA